VAGRSGGSAREGDFGGDSVERRRAAAGNGAAGEPQDGRKKNGACEGDYGDALRLCGKGLKAAVTFCLEAGIAPIIQCVGHDWLHPSLYERELTDAWTQRRTEVGRK
jgi:hypothetical protein